MIARTAPSKDSLASIKLLTGLLSLTAGSTDVIGFLGLGGLFVAHVTGNLVILAAHFVTGGGAQVASILSVPVFTSALCLARLLAGGFEAIGLNSLRPLLLLQFSLLAGSVLITAGYGSYNHQYHALHD